MPLEASVLKPVEAQDAFGPDAFAEATGATPKQVDDLTAFKTLLEDWSSRMNLVGPSALADFWRRHAFDSAQLLALEPECFTWVDIGAGAGFPGLVLAILLKDVPGARVELIESLSKRCLFLRAVIDTLALPAVVRQGRAETLSPGDVGMVTARACAPMPRLLAFAAPHLRRAGRGLFLKGGGVEAELETARADWRFKSTLIQSRSDPSGRIVRIEGLARV